MRALLARLKAGTEELNYGRDAIAGMARQAASELGDGPVRVLDLGLGTGADLDRIERDLAPREVRRFGVDSHGPNIEAARERGIEVESLDIERERLPFGDGSMDLVVANQVFEHLKEIFWVTSEAARVLKPGGALIVGVPNLASLHSRVMLALGMQPSPVEVLGPHVRGFTRGGFQTFLMAGGHFEVLEVKGGNFYPFPRPMARLCARLWPGGAVSLFFRCRRTRAEGSFLEVLDRQFFETPFFKGR